MSFSRFAVMGSTRGSSFVPILKAWKAGQLSCEPAFVLSNRKQAGILDKARHAGLPCEWLPLKSRDRESYDRATSELLKQHNVDFILLVGYMRILSPFLVNEWSGRIVNVHPSLLPKYGGMMDLEVHQAVIDAGEVESGCSIHIVSEELDGGPVIIQKKCKVTTGDSAESLKAKVQNLEGEAFLELLKAPEKYLA